MSGVEQLASSFGDPNAQPPPPPTPPPTTSTVFPSPVFETPKNTQGHFDDSSGWTPRFAEEYSVFNHTPGNLRGSPQNGFVGQFGPLTPYQVSSARQKRRLSAEGIAEEIATHATHFSPNPNLPLPPVDPSRRLPSSPGALILTHAQAGAQSSNGDSREHRSFKKARCGASAAEHVQGQTATPPPSARKGERKLVPKVSSDSMQQHEQEYGDFSAAAAQHAASMATNGYLHSPADMFDAFPMSAPATAPVFTDARAFWETDPGSMAGMDIDFSAAGADIFQATPPAAGQGHRPAGSLDWGRANQMFQETGILPLQQQQQQQPQQQQLQQAHHQQPSPQNMQRAQQQNQLQANGGTQQVQMAQPAAKRERPLAPKPAMSLDTTALDQTGLEAAIYHTPVDDPFGMVHPTGGVDPGLLFGRPSSSSMEAALFNNQMQPPSSSAPEAPQSATQEAFQTGNTTPVGLGISKAPMRGELRRSLSVKELGPSQQKQHRGTSSNSPIKPGGRPGLSRSFSESRSKRPVGRPLSIAPSPSSSLPILAPAVKPVQPQEKLPAPGNPGVNASRPSSHGSRSSGRSSPPKAHHHHRLSSLTSIPEARARANVKFTIDASGRAYVETITPAVEDEAVPPASLRRRRSTQSVTNRPGPRWESTDEERELDLEEDDESSTDDELIVIPSRNASFALPDPLKVSGSRPRFHHGPQRSFSEQSSSSVSHLVGEHQPDDDPESEAETVMNDGVSCAGDAASELEKLRQSRQAIHRDGESLKLMSSMSGSSGHRQRFSSGSGFGGGFGGSGRAPLFHHHSTISPTTQTDASLPTPSTDSRSNGVRCVCNEDSTVADGGFMVQCEACDMWLHGKCINIPKHSMMPSVYICAFCVRTPTARVGRTPTASFLTASSPLAHKSFPQKFR